MNLGLVMKFYRVFKQVSLRELASEIGISAATLSRIENGKFVPDLVTFKKILDWLLR